MSTETSNSGLSQKSGEFFDLTGFASQFAPKCNCSGYVILSEVRAKNLQKASQK
jgi:hypothetical protein